MKFSSTQNSKYLKAADLNDQPKKVTIAHVELENVSREDEDPKPVCYFKGEKKGLVLNQTNGRTIADLYSDEMDQWVGKEITLIPTETDYQGKRVACIRLRKPKSAQVVTPPPAATGTDDEDVGF